jgi:hypothetical protein
VHHPGIVARDFDVAIQEEFDERFPVRVQERINEAR